jgi:hypothetical protein
MGKPDRNRISLSCKLPYVKYTPQTTTTTTTTTEEPDIVLYPTGSCSTTTKAPVLIAERFVIYPEGFYKVSDIITVDNGCGPYKLTLQGQYSYLFRIIGKSLYYTGGSNILCPNVTGSISVTVALEDIANRYPAIYRQFTVNFTDC